METRWAERHTAHEDFHDLYESITDCLDEMCHPPTDSGNQWIWDAKTIAEVAGLLKDIQSSEFVVSFYACRYFFA